MKAGHCGLPLDAKTRRNWAPPRPPPQPRERFWRETSLPMVKGWDRVGRRFNESGLGPTAPEAPHAANGMASTLGIMGKSSSLACRLAGSRSAAWKPRMRTRALNELGLARFRQGEATSSGSRTTRKACPACHASRAVGSRLVWRLRAGRPMGSALLPALPEEDLSIRPSVPRMGRSGRLLLCRGRIAHGDTRRDMLRNGTDGP